MSASSYITDGYTEKAVINAYPNLHGRVEFEYRTMLSDRIREVLHSWDLISATEKTRRIHAVIEKQVIRWNLEHNGKTLPITAIVLAHLKRRVVEQMFNIVMQLDTTDEVETADTELDLDKVLSGPDPEDDAKN